MAGIGDLLGGMLGGGQGGSGGADIQKLIQPILEMLQSGGGIQGLLEKLQGSAVGQQASSWVSAGPNVPVDPDSLASAIGVDKVQELASKAGVPVEQAKEGLSQVLPGLVDKLTPSGSMPGADQFGEILNQIPGADQFAEQLKGILGGLFGGGGASQPPATPSA